MKMYNNYNSPLPPVKGITHRYFSYLILPRPYLNDWNANVKLHGWIQMYMLIRNYNLTLLLFLCLRHSENGGGAFSVTPVRAFVRALVRASVRPCVRSISKFGVRSITFKKTSSIRFIFGMLIYNIKTQVMFDLGYNSLICDGVMGLL